MRSCDSPKRDAAPNRTKITLTVAASLTIDKAVDVVLVTADDVTVTLPFQPAAGKGVLVATKNEGTLVAAGCPTGCACPPGPTGGTGCDSFCVSTTLAPVTLVEVAPFDQQLFTYFPPGPTGPDCGCGPGCWVFGTGATGPTGP